VRHFIRVFDYNHQQIIWLNFFISYEFVDIPADVPSNTLIVGAGSFLETQRKQQDYK
jgi:hypothetical protein